MQDSSAKFLTFAIASQRFGIRVEDVQEIVRAVRLAHLPKAPLVIEGLIDLRGTVIAVLDIRSRFGLPSKAVAPADHLIIARARERVVGIRVDRAMDVLTLRERDIGDISDIAPTSEYIAGVAKNPRR
jgi:purine-binding chemotaxis protein CheW